MKEWENKNPVNLNNLDKIRMIESGKLNDEFYFQSLLEEAHHKGLLSDGDIERLQYALIIRYFCISSF